MVLYCNRKKTCQESNSLTRFLYNPLPLSLPSLHPPTNHGLFPIAALCWSASMRQNLPVASSNKDTWLKPSAIPASSTDTNQVQWLDLCPVLRPLFEWGPGNNTVYDCWVFEMQHCSQGAHRCSIKALRKRGVTAEFLFQFSNMTWHQWKSSTFWEIPSFFFLPRKSILLLYLAHEYAGYLSLA